VSAAGLTKAKVKKKKKISSDYPCSSKKTRFNRAAMVDGTGIGEKAHKE